MTWLAVLAWRSHHAEFVPGQRWHDLVGPLAILAIFCAPAGILILRALGQIYGLTYADYADRLAPLATRLGLCGLQLVALLAWLDRQEIGVALRPARQLSRLPPWARCAGVFRGHHSHRPDTLHPRRLLGHSHHAAAGMADPAGAGHQPGRAVPGIPS